MWTIDVDQELTSVAVAADVDVGVPREPAAATSRWTSDDWTRRGGLSAMPEVPAPRAARRASATLRRAR